jgi:DeoR family transcriptional regulator, aga operon transcriptional repressor
MPNNPVSLKQPHCRAFMKVFISHSSKQKLFAKAIKQYLPPSLQLWIDEYEIPVGENIADLIGKSIVNDCDYFILLVDAHAMRSAWVDMEIDLALKKEKVIGRAFLLPVVLDKSAWEEAAAKGLKDRKYLYCDDFSDYSIKSLCDKIVNDLFAALSKDIKSDREKRLSNQVQKLNEAEILSVELSRAISTIVHPYRSANPLRIADLIRELNQFHVLNGEVSIEELKSIVHNLIRHNRLSGIRIVDDTIYVSQERYSFKSSIHLDKKRRIAREAYRHIESGSIIALDGGSTTLELAKLISNGLRQRDLDGLKIITNSVPATFEILTTLSELGLSDNNTTCNVFITGGWARPISMTLISDRVAAQATDVNSLVSAIGSPDICFLGANGVCGDLGFAVHNQYEVLAKKSMLQHSKKKFILTDSSKFRVQQGNLFASFEEALDIITQSNEEDRDILKRYTAVIEQTKSRITVLE